MEPPAIRYNRFEQSIAIKWADSDYWYRIEPEAMIYGDLGDRCRTMKGAFNDTPNEEWIDPFADPRPDIRRWTEPMRRQLQDALRMLDNAEQHPWSG